MRIPWDLQEFMSFFDYYKSSILYCALRFPSKIKKVQQGKKMLLIKHL